MNQNERPKKTAFRGIFAYDEPSRVKIAKNVAGEGREGWMLAKVVVAGMVWATVLWDGDEDPVTFKAGCLLVKSDVWSVVKS